MINNIYKFTQKNEANQMVAQEIDMSLYQSVKAVYRGKGANIRTSIAVVLNSGEKGTLDFRDDYKQVEAFAATFRHYQRTASAESAV